MLSIRAIQRVTLQAVLNQHVSHAVNTSAQTVKQYLMHIQKIHLQMHMAFTYMIEKTQ